MKLLLDEMFPAALAEHLRDPGHDVEAVKQHAGLTGLPDRVLFDRAQTDARAVVTENVPDFVRLDAEYRASGQGHFGLILTSNASFPRGQPATSGILLKALDVLLRQPDLPATAASTVYWLAASPPAS